MLAADLQSGTNMSLEIPAIIIQKRKKFKCPTMKCSAKEGRMKAKNIACSERALRCAPAVDVKSQTPLWTTTPHMPDQQE